MSLLLPLSLSQISLSLTDKEFLLVKLKLSNRVSEVLIDTDTIGLPINVPNSPRNNVIINGGINMRKADLPEAFNIASSFEFEINKKVKIAPIMTTKANASMVSIGMTIRIAKMTGMAAMPTTTGFTIFIKATFSQISLGKIT